MSNPQTLKEYIQENPCLPAEHKSLIQELQSNEAFYAANKYQWQDLSNITRKWAVLSGHEKDQSNYQNLQNELR